MKKISTFFIFLGILAVLISCLIVFLTFLPVVIDEINYSLKKPAKDVIVSLQSEKTKSAKPIIYPVDEEFGIIIPKINANAKVMANVDANNETEYQIALTKGVAHARGTAYPGRPGNVFIFSHSSVDFFLANRYNSVFYLLDKLEQGDSIYLLYQKEKFKYIVTEKKTVEASEIKYLEDIDNKKTVTLMTCWPPGTNFKRLVVVGEIARL